jgi:hypothetical protein
MHALARPGTFGHVVFQVLACSPWPGRAPVGSGCEVSLFGKVREGGEVSGAGEHGGDHGDWHGLALDPLCIFLGL